MRTMFVSPAFSVPVLQERADRRTRQRYAYPAVVHLNGRPMPGRDISSKGLAVLIEAPAVGDVVTVTLAGANADAAEIASSARVVRVDRAADGFVVGLEFLE